MLIRTNEQVTNKQEVQNLIVSIIFRQEHPFTKLSCLKIINRYLRRSSYYWSKIVEDELVKYLDLYQRNNKLRCKNGIFHPKSVADLLLSK